MKEFLKVGDVIFLDKGMTVFAPIPEMFVYSNRKTSTRLVNHNITVGQNYENDTNIEKSIIGVVNNVYAAFQHEGFEIELNKVSKFVRENISIAVPQKFNFKKGEFVVTKTSLEGGSYRNYDEYPDGHRVYCKRLKNGRYDPEGDEVSFYQSGCFTAMIEDITPISQMKKEVSYSFTLS